MKLIARKIKGNGPVITVNKKKNLPQLNNTPHPKQAGQSGIVYKV